MQKEFLVFFPPAVFPSQKAVYSWHTKVCINTPQHCCWDGYRKEILITITMTTSPLPQ